MSVNDDHLSSARRRAERLRDAIEERSERQRLLRVRRIERSRRRRSRRIEARRRRQRGEARGRNRIPRDRRPVSYAPEGVAPRYAEDEAYVYERPTEAVLSRWHPINLTRDGEPDPVGRLARIIRSERKRRGWTLRSLARRADAPFSAVSAISAGRASLRSGTLGRRYVLRVLHALNLLYDPPAPERSRWYPEHLPEPRELRDAVRAETERWPLSSEDLLRLVRREIGDDPRDAGTIDRLKRGELRVDPFALTRERAVVISVLRVLRL